DPRRRIVAVNHTTPVPDDKNATAFLYSRDVPWNSPEGDRVVKAARKAVREGKLPATIAADNKTDAEVYAAVLADPAAVELLNPKKYDYFVLTRVSPDDSLKVEGDVTLTATAGQDKNFNPSVDFRFNGAGAQAFGRITRRNRPSGSITRNLAIVLDDRIVS